MFKKDDTKIGVCLIHLTKCRQKWCSQVVINLTFPLCCKAWAVLIYRTILHTVESSYLPRIISLSHPSLQDNTGKNREANKIQYNTQYCTCSAYGETFFLMVTHHRKKKPDINDTFFLWQCQETQVVPVEKLALLLFLVCLRKGLV